MTERDACSQWEPLLDAFTDGELDAAHALACERHVEACPACGPKLQAIQATRAALGRPGLRHAAPPSLRSRVETALAAERSGANREGQRRTPVSGSRLARLGRWSIAPSAGLL